MLDRARGLVETLLIIPIRILSDEVAIDRNRLPIRGRASGLFFDRAQPLSFRQIIGCRREITASPRAQYVIKHDILSTFKVR